MNEQHWELINEHFPKLDKVIDSGVTMAFDHHPELPQHLRASVAKRVRGQVRGYIAHMIELNGAVTPS